MPEETAASVMLLSNRTCCVCTEPYKDVQIHHIDENPSNNDPDNLAVLCFQCHNDTQIFGGFGRKLNASVVRAHREEWYERVRKRKEDTDRIASVQAVTGTKADFNELDYKKQGHAHLLFTYLERILRTHKAQLMLAQVDWDDGRTFSMMAGNNRMVDFYEEVLVELATFYPEGSFEGKHPKLFFSEVIESRTSFHICIAEPEGPGSGGSMERVSIGGRIRNDLRKMVRDMVWQLYFAFFDITDISFKDWEKEWMKDE